MSRLFRASVQLAFVFFLAFLMYGAYAVQKDLFLVFIFGAFAILFLMKVAGNLKGDEYASRRIL